MREPEVTRLIDEAARDAVWLAPRLTNTMRRVDEWSGGYPAGGGSPTRGGDDTSLTERIVLAGAYDIHGADLLEAQLQLRLASDALAWLRRFDARNHAVLTGDDPRRRPPVTATCLGCGRTIAANAIDPVLAGHCTSSKTRPHGGCHADWLDAKREKDRVRQAAHRARQRGVDLAEECEGVTHE